MYGSKLTWFLCPAGNNLLIWGSTDLGFVWDVETDLVLFASRKYIGFSVNVEVDLVFMPLVQMNWISVWEIEIYKHFSVEIGIDLVFVLRSQNKACA